jgi:nitrogen regulatory protein PII
MKKIIAVIRPHQIDDVREALQNVGVGGITITETLGYGRQRGHAESYRGTEYSVAFNPKVKIEVVAAASKVPGLIEAIAKVARTGKVGDGKIFVEPVEEAVRIRTGERNVDAV